MPTKEEAEAYKRYLEQLMAFISEQKISERSKKKLINYYLDRWKIADEALRGMGIPLDDEDKESDK